MPHPSAPGAVPRPPSPLTRLTGACALSLLLLGFGCKATVVPPDPAEQDWRPCTDADIDGSCAEEDCDDADPARGLGFAEICDGKDNDCDGQLSADERADADTDGSPRCADCNDDDPSMRPGGEEICDGKDNDCSGLPEPEEEDADEDGYLACEDCDDASADTYPGAPEICDRLDDDCDGVIPEQELDLDNDHFSECEGDCGPLNGSVLPAPEHEDDICDGLDTDCDGVLGPEELDGDEDGAIACADCDDDDPNRNPLAVELCNGVDDNCDGALFTDLLGNSEAIDADGDGALACADCDDGDAAAHPGAYEIDGNGVDDDCDGSVDEAATLVSLPQGEPFLRGWQDDDCASHGLSSVEIGFELGPDGAVVGGAEAGLLLSGELSGGTPYRYASSDGTLLARGGALFATPDASVSAINIEFDEPQSMVLFAIAGFDASFAASYLAELRWQGDALASAPLFAVTPGGGWSYVGLRSPEGVAFDQLILYPADPAEVIALDDLRICE